MKRDLKYYSLIFALFLLFFSGQILHGHAPMVYSSLGFGFGNTDAFTTIAGNYKMGHDFPYGSRNWDFSNGLGLSKTGLTWSPFPFPAIVQAFLVDTCGVGVFNAGGMVLSGMLLFACFTFFHFLRAYLGWEPFWAILAVMIEMGATPFTEAFNYAGIYFFSPCALITVFRFVKNPITPNTVLLAMAAAFPLFTGMFSVYINYCLLIVFALAVLIYQERLGGRNILPHIKQAPIFVVFSILLNSAFSLPFIGHLLEFPLPRNGVGVDVDLAMVNPAVFLANIAHNVFYSMSPLMLLARIVLAKWDIVFDRTPLTPFLGVACLIFIYGFFKSRFRVATYWFGALLAFSFAYFVLNSTFHFRLGVLDSLKFIKNQGVVAMPFLAIILVDGIKSIFRDEVEVFAVKKIMFSVIGISAALAVTSFLLFNTGFSQHMKNAILSKAPNTVFFEATRPYYLSAPTNRLRPTLDGYWGVDAVFWAFQLAAFGFYALWARSKSNNLKASAASLILLSVLVHPFYQWGGFWFKNELPPDSYLGMGINEKNLFDIMQKESFQGRGLYFENYCQFSRENKIEFLDAKRITRENCHDLHKNKYYMNNYISLVPTLDGGGVMMGSRNWDVYHAFFSSFPNSYGLYHSVDDSRQQIFSKLFGLKYILSPYPISGMEMISESGDEYWRYLLKVPISRDLVQFPPAVKVFPAASDVFAHFKEQYHLDGGLALSSTVSYLAAPDTARLGIPPSVPLNKGNEVLSINYGANGAVIEISAKTNGFIEINHALDRYWHAAVDGEEREMVDVNYLFKAVPIKAGEHRVELVYRYPPRIIGMWLNIIVLIVGAGVVVSPLLSSRGKVVDV